MKNLLTSLFLATALTKKGQFMMKFTKNTRIVQSWVALVNAGTYTLEQVPNLFNLRKVVAEVLAEQAAEAEKSETEG